MKEHWQLKYIFQFKRRNIPRSSHKITFRKKNTLNNHIEEKCIDFTNTKEIKNNAGGFTALPSARNNIFGLLDMDGPYSAYWWSSTEINEMAAWSRHIYAYNDKLSNEASGKSYGYCVRLIKNK